MSELEEVSAAEAIELAKGMSRLIDVREPDEWEAGHAPEAYSLPMSQLSERIGELSPDDTLLIVCHGGARSLRVTGTLLERGFTAINVAGGMMAWQSAGGVVVADGPAPSAK